MWTQPTCQVVSPTWHAACSKARSVWSRGRVPRPIEAVMVSSIRLTIAMPHDPGSPCATRSEAASDLPSARLESR